MKFPFKFDARMHVILITACLDSFGMGFIIPSLPDVIRRFETGTAAINLYYGLFVAVFALFQFISSPVMGVLSDRFGRRPLLLISLITASVDYLFMAFAPTLPLLFLGRVISGATGSSIAVANSYISDISTPENRAAAFGKLGAAFGLGFVIAPAVGGLLSTHYGYAAPFLAAAALNFGNCVLGFFALPESLPVDQRRAHGLDSFHPLESIRKAFRLAPALILVYTCYFMASQVYPAIWTLYTQYKFGWSAMDVGLSLCFFGVLMIITQGMLTGKITEFFGERKTVIIGTLIGSIGYAGYGLAGAGWVMYAVALPDALSFVTGSALQSLISQEAPPSEQGELQGALISISSLTEIAGPLFYTGLFSAFTGPDALAPFPGGGFAAAAVISLASLLILARHSGKPVAAAAEPQA